MCASQALNRLPHNLSSGPALVCFVAQLKPDNLLLDASGTCKIGDLGASRLEDPNRTMSDSVGTPLFSAPEQLSHLRYGTFADVWAAGCVLVCVSHDSKGPYPHESPEGLLARVARGETRPSLAESELLHGAVLDCCRSEPGERLSAARLAEYLGVLDPS